MRNSRKIIISGVMACLVIFCVWRVFTSGGNELRLPATNYMRVLENKDLPALIENSGDGEHVWGVRENANSALVAPAFVAAFQFIMDVPAIIGAQYNDAAFLESTSLASVSQSTQPVAPILRQDGAHAPSLFASHPYGENDPLDVDGRPLRWTLPDNLLAGYSIVRPVQTPKIRPRPVIPTEPAGLSKLPTSARAGHYRDLVENFARRYNLSTELVMAIIHSESDFSPSLVSNKSAMGLMQLLPSTASDEVHRFLYGHRGQVSFEQLSVPEINIRYGTAYLHILLNRYFAEVRDWEVKEACAIASYNLGPNRFLRLYGPTNELAVEKINSMTPEEFHDDLHGRLPAKETRYFVKKVRRMKQHYISLQ